MRDTWNMTPDEARKYILQNWFDGDENVNAFVCGDEEYTAMAIAVEALERTEWHYPSRGELPKENGKYFCKIISLVTQHSEGWYDVVLWGSRGWVLNKYTQVVAWQYIVPPKEEE